MNIDGPNQKLVTLQDGSCHIHSVSCTSSLLNTHIELGGGPADTLACTFHTHKFNLKNTR